MSNKTKATDKTEALKPKHNINLKKLVRKFVAKPIAYVTVLVLAAYGMHQLLRTLNNTASTVLTVLAVMALVYIMFDEG